jgi:hypothetical protein
MCFRFAPESKTSEEIHFISQEQWKCITAVGASEAIKLFRNHSHSKKSMVECDGGLAAFGHEISNASV